MLSELNESTSNFDKAIETLNELLIVYRSKPGERIIEGELAGRLGIFRTPLRGALYRLTSGGFLGLISSREFFYRKFQPREIFKFYQLREVLDATRRQNADAVATNMEAHISRRLNEIKGGIKDGVFQNLYCQTRR